MDSIDWLKIMSNYYLYIAVFSGIWAIGRKVVNSVLSAVTKGKIDI